MKKVCALGPTWHRRGSGGYPPTRTQWQTEMRRPHGKIQPMLHSGPSGFTVPKIVKRFVLALGRL